MRASKMKVPNSKPTTVDWILTFLCLFLVGCAILLVDVYSHPGKLMLVAILRYLVVATAVTIVAAIAGIIEFDPRDVWVGVFWDKRTTPAPWKPDLQLGVLHIWVVLIPCCPIHLEVAQKELIKQCSR